MPQYPWLPVELCCDMTYALTAKLQAYLNTFLDTYKIKQQQCFHSHANYEADVIVILKLHQLRH